ncbi:translocation/assembly module TamB domain-containing protein [Endozoicomonas sp. NE40]|uniref:Translocation and assembly module TamB n=1 Tax=Endozoicomonas lisbonensis TaxID=3120522 RepID=A0ABV2SPM5_9GAMM
MKRIISGLFAIIVLCFTAVASLLLTSTGNRWLWQFACEQLPSRFGELQGDLEGSLLQGWQFRTLSWHRSDLEADLKVDIQQLSFSLSPEHLLRGELFIDQLSIERIGIENLSTRQNKEQETDFSDIEIPSFTMPLPVEIKTLNIRELDYSQRGYSEQEKTWQFQNIGLAARAEKQTFSIQQFEVTHDSASLLASASITLSAPYPVSAQLAFSPGIFPADSFLLDIALHDKLLLPDTSVSVSGYLTDYRIELSSQPGKEKNSTLLLNGALSGSFEQLFIHSLEAQWQQQAASASGQLSWQHGIDWQGTFTFRNLNPGLWLADYPGQLSGTVRSSASAADQEWEVEVPQLQVSGVLREFPVTLSGQLMVNSEESVRTEQLQLNIGSNQLNLNGYIDQNWNLKGVIDAPDLTELYPLLSGDLSGDFELTGSRDLPHVAYRLMAEQLAINRLVIDGLQSEGSLKDLKALDNQAHLQIDSLKIDQQRLQAIEIAITGNPEAHQLSAKTEGKSLSSHLQLEGSLLDKQWNGKVKVLKTLSLLGQWDLQKAFTLSATQQKVEFQSFCLTSLPASLCLGKGNAGNRQANISFELKQLDVARFTPLLPEGLQWQSELNASGKVVLREGKPSISLNLHTPGGQLNVAELQGEYDKLVLNAVLGGNQLNSKLQFESSQLGNADLSIKVTDIEKSRLLDGQLTIDHLMLEIFQPFIPGTRHLSGIARAGLQMRGSLHNPLLQGEVVISDVALSSEFCDISRINSRMQIQGSSAVVSSQLQVGEGLGDINGTLSWKRGQFTGLLHLTR